MNPWPQVVYTVLMSRWPDFAAAVINESMSLMAPGGSTVPVMTAPVDSGFTVGRREHHAALREAASMFLASLKISDLDPNANEHLIPLDPDDDRITVNGVPFSKRHFARNFEQQFSADVKRFTTRRTVL